MKVLIIELDYHPEVVRGIFYHLENTRIDLGLVTRKSIYEQIQLPDDPDHLCLIGNDESPPEALSTSRIKDEDWDLILFTTAQTNFRELCKLKFDAPMAVIVHNIHAYFDRWKIEFRPHPFFIWKDLSFLLRIGLFKLDFFYRKAFLKKVDHFLFPSEFMYAYAATHYPNWKGKFMNEPIHWASAKATHHEQDTSCFVITVIGTIDSRRREYEQIIGLTKFLQKEAPIPVKIILAGKPSGKYGRRIQQKMMDLRSEKINIVTYRDYVTDKQMSEIAKETDLIVAPVVRNARHHIWKEIYGRTKISGNINNTIEFQKPTLLPSFYPVNEDLHPLIIPYQTMDELNTEVLNRMVNTQSPPPKSPMTREAVRDEILTVLNHIINPR